MLHPCTNSSRTRLACASGHCRGSVPVVRTLGALSPLAHIDSTTTSPCALHASLRQDRKQERAKRKPTPRYCGAPYNILPTPWSSWPAEHPLPLSARAAAGCTRHSGLVDRVALTLAPQPCPTLKRSRWLLLTVEIWTPRRHTPQTHTKHTANPLILSHRNTQEGGRLRWCLPACAKDDGRRPRGGDRDPAGKCLPKLFECSHMHARTLVSCSF